MYCVTFINNYNQSIRKEKKKRKNLNVLLN